MDGPTIIIEITLLLKIEISSIVYQKVLQQGYKPYLKNNIYYFCTNGISYSSLIYWKQMLLIVVKFELFIIDRIM